MRNLKHLILIIGVISSIISCKSTKNKRVSDFPIKNESINLFAFIGEKITVTEFDPNPKENFIRKIQEIERNGDTVYAKQSFIMDFGFKNKYKVHQNIFNEIKTDYIDFLAFDHYGRPEFENYEYVLLYISIKEKDGLYYHLKYLFDPLIKINDSTWKGLKGETIEELFRQKKNGDLKEYNVFN